MHELKLNPDSNFRKCAKICGDTSGNYHPHGQAVIYPTLISMSQKWNTMYPLVQGQGNIGSIDGDNPAAMRYVQARLTKIANTMMQQMNTQIISYRDNYDSTRKQPTILPSKFPNLICNGCFGIAVGRSTNIPSHNIGQVCDLIIKYLKTKSLTDRQILSTIKAPDFPTGAYVYGKQGIEQYLLTGKGRFYIRGKLHVETYKNKKLIVITQIPYGVSKDSISNRILKSIGDQKINNIIDVYDQSNQQGIRLCLQVKKNEDEIQIIEQIYKHTNMQISYTVNCQVLIDNIPTMVNMNDLVKHFVQFRCDIINKRTQYELTMATKRVKVVRCHSIVLKNYKDILQIINEQDQKTITLRLKQKYKFDDDDVKIILDMKLNKFTKLQKETLKKQITLLKEQIKRLRYILDSEQGVYEQLRKEVLDIKKQFNHKRKTQILN